MFTILRFPPGLAILAPGGLGAEPVDEECHVFRVLWLCLICFFCLYIGVVYDGSTALCAVV